MIQGIKGNRNRFFPELVLVLFFIAAGLMMSGHVFTQYGQLIVRNQDEQLFHLASSVDRNINSLVERCETTLDYVARRRAFLEAEETWKTTGKTEDLLFCMEENLLVQDNLITVMLMLEQGEVRLSTDGNLGYTLLEEAGSDQLKYCQDREGRIYLAFLHESEGNIRYVALMDLDKFYQEIVNVELAEYSWVILTDSSSEILIYHQQNQILIDPVDGVSSATWGFEGLNILLSQQEKKVVGASSYEYFDRVSQEDYTARIVVLPSEQTRNRAFGVGVVTNFENVMEPLKGAAIRLLCYGGMITVGVILLLRIVIRFRKRNEADRQKLELLQEKSEKDLQKLDLLREKSEKDLQKLELLREKNEKDLQEIEILREKNEMLESVHERMKDLAHHQRLETIGTLTSGIAHEFNNLLTPIMGYSILSLEQIPEENEELYDNILEIYQASRRAKDIIARLSELSGKNTAASLQRVSLKSVIQKVENVTAPVLPSGVEVAIHIREACVVEGNETQLSQMLLNLVLNAFHSMEERGGILTITLFREEGEAVWKVQDTGCGIPADVMEHIFEPFFSTRETGKGTGLGLAIVSQVLEEHNGSIAVESEEGRGAVFTVRLPLKAEAAES